MRHGKPEICNTNQGTQFTSPDFEDGLEDADKSFTLRYNCPARTTAGAPYRAPSPATKAPSFPEDMG